MPKEKIANIVKIQMDYFFRDPATVAKAFMATGSKSILREAKKRGIDLGPHLRKEFDDYARRWGVLKTR